MATSQADLAAKGKQAIVVSDQVIKDLKIPIMATVLELQDQVFKIADDLGIGEPVRALVYAIRETAYVGNTAGAMLGVHAGAGIAAAGSTVTASVLAIGTLGAVGAIVSAGLLAIFGSDDEDEKQKAALKRSQAAIRRLADRLTLAGFAQEQDSRKQDESLLAMLPWGDPAKHKKAAAEAGLLAEFYRRTQAELSGYRRDLFECLSNIARWEVTLKQFKGMTHEERSTITGVGFGTSKPTDYFGTVLQGHLSKERLKLSALAKHKPRPKIALTLPGQVTGKTLGVLGLLAYAAYKIWRSRG